MRSMYHSNKKLKEVDNAKIQFNDLQQELTETITNLNQKKVIPFIVIRDLADKTLRWMKLDIYLPTAVSIKTNLLQQSSQLIADHCASQTLSLKNIANLLDLLAKDNLTFYYDQGWLYEEKCSYFKPIVQGLTVQLQERLATTNPSLSTQAIANCMYALSVWHLQPDPKLVAMLLKAMENAVAQKKAVASNVAFHFLKGFTRLIHDRSFRDENPSGSEFLAVLAEAALPLLLQDEPPLKMFQVRNLMLNTVANLLILIPDFNYKKYGQLYFDTSMQLLKQYESIGIEEIYNALPDGVVPHKELLLALENRQYELLDNCEVAAPPRKNQPKLNVYHKDIGKVYFSLKTYCTYLKQLHEAENPRGSQWYLTKFCESIIFNFEDGLITYPLEEIKDYLKLLRHCLLDVNVPAIHEAVMLLSKEALTNVHAKQIDADLAIELLWINLVLAKVTNDPNIAYSMQERAKLFSKVSNYLINPDQARALFAIQTLQWHGGLAFSAKLIKQMQDHAAVFAKGASPSQAEQTWFKKIENNLPEAQRGFLQANYICTDTGQEIDIVYLGEQKIAIHIDGPTHFNPVTGQPNVHTCFRDICLAGAGWTSFSINLIDGQKDAEKLVLLQDKLARLGSPIKKQQPHISKRDTKPSIVKATRTVEVKPKPTANKQPQTSTAIVKPVVQCKPDALEPSANNISCKKSDLSKSDAQLIQTAQSVSSLKQAKQYSLGKHNTSIGSTQTASIVTSKPTLSSTSLSINNKGAGLIASSIYATTTKQNTEKTVESAKKAPQASQKLKLFDQTIQKPKKEKQSSVQQEKSPQYAP